MRAVEALVVLAVVGAALFAIVVRLARPVLRRWRQRQRRNEPWKMVEHSDGELVSVLAHKPGDDDLLIGSAAFASEDFDSRLYELRANGREKVYALNQGRR